MDDEGLTDVESATREAWTSRQVVHALADAVLGKGIRSVTPIASLGAVNLVYVVATARGEVVLRTHKAEDTASKALREYAKEAWCLERAAAAGIPGPEVLAIGENGGRAYLIQTRVPGVNGKMSPVPSADLMRLIGAYARKIHEIAVDGFGDDVEGFTSGKGRAGWLGWVDYNLGELTAEDPLIRLGVYAPPDQANIRESFTWLRSLNLKIALNHGDLARRNTVVGPDAVYLLDWGCAEMHVAPHYDIHAIRHGYALDNANFQAFLEGYGIGTEAWKRLRPEVEGLALLKAFDLVRWAIDRCPERVVELADKARALAGRSWPE